MKAEDYLIYAIGVASGFVLAAICFYHPVNGLLPSDLEMP